MSVPWFFLSYSRVDSEGTPYVSKFYKDLVNEVRRLAALRGAKDSDVGFFDASAIKTGSSWREQLSNTLNTCRVLVCLYSQGYFNSEYCGREFHLFRSRIDDYIGVSPEHTPRPQLILPILWDPPDWLPAPLPYAVSEIQYSDAELGESYAREGLYVLIKSFKFDSDYQEFLVKFARRIVQAGRADVLRPLSRFPDISEVPNALQEKPHLSSVEATPLDKNAFLRVAQFVYVAGNGAELMEVRDNVASYAEQGGREWRPYHPDAPKPIGILSQGVATMEGLQYETYPVSEDLIEKLRAAEAANSVVVIVVDPWSIQVKPYRERMLDFDETDFLNCRVLVPWNDKDEETSKSFGVLSTDVRRTFTRKFILNTYIKDSIKSLEELEREIYISINEIRSRLLLKAKVHRRVDNTGGAIPSIAIPAKTST